MKTAQELKKITRLAEHNIAETNKLAKEFETRRKLQEEAAKHAQWSIDVEKAWASFEKLVEKHAADGVYEFTHELAERDEQGLFYQTIFRNRMLENGFYCDVDNVYFNKPLYPVHIANLAPKAHMRYSIYVSWLGAPEKE